jgi:BirA family biotin operon repressor/biotin-[acetyl-CoA-carboxylase] ligase
MNLIKLNATESTNTFLKELRRSEALQNFTVVRAENQLVGRGQMDASWHSESGKNLTFSVFVKFKALDLKNQFYLSKAVSVGLLTVLNSELNTNFSIKWPNDILADGFKIAGTLIENSVKKTKITESVIGIGLNVNQTFFDKLPKATSLKKISNQNFDLEILLTKIINALKKYIQLLDQNEFETIDEMYFKYLYKLGVPSMFKDAYGELFMGKILTVTQAGLLQLEVQDENVKSFDLKQVSFVL